MIKNLEINLGEEKIGFCSSKTGTTIYIITRQLKIIIV